MSYVQTKVLRPTIRLNTITAEDNFIQVFSNPKEYTFYDIPEVEEISIKKIVRPIINGWRKEVYINMNIDIDETSIVYERQVYDIMSVIGDWGGVV